jgi:iron(III) transport system substrate-binding protein
MIHTPRRRGSVPERAAVTAFAMAVSLVLATACGSSQSTSSAASSSAPAAATSAQSGAGSSATSLAAARKEGFVTVYSGLDPLQNDSITAGFEKAYPGVSLHILRVGADEQILTRVEAEESAGEHNVDVILLGDDPCSFIATHPSWFQSWPTAGVPSYSQFAQSEHQWVRSCGSPDYTYPVLGVTEWGIAYNTNLMKTAPTWENLIKPQYAGKVLLADPRIADAYYAIWYLLLKTYGPSYLQAIGKNSKLISGGVQAGQEVAAGGADAVIPSHIGVVNSVKNGTNAPIAISNPLPTVGLELNGILMASDRLTHPAASKLFLDYLLTKSGSEALMRQAGKSIYDITSGYTIPAYGPSVAAKAQINKLLGLS